MLLALTIVERAHLATWSRSAQEFLELGRAFLPASRHRWRVRTISSPLFSKKGRGSAYSLYGVMSETKCRTADFPRDCLPPFQRESFPDIAPDIALAMHGILDFASQKFFVKNSQIFGQNRDKFFNHAHLCTWGLAPQFNFLKIKLPYLWPLLILFDPHAFVFQGQECPSKLPSPLVFPTISTDFTPTP